MDANPPISADHIQCALGSDQLQQLMSQLGVSQNEAASGVADLLAQVVDKLSPLRSLPQGGIGRIG